MSELTDLCVSGLKADEIFRSIARTANGQPFYLNTVGAASFSPADLDNLVLWLDSNVGVTGDPVSLWEDQSASNNDASQGNVNFRPDFRPNQLNGYPDIKGDGTDDFLQLGSVVDFLQDTGFTMFFVWDVVGSGYYYMGSSVATDYINNQLTRFRFFMGGGARDFAFAGLSNGYFIDECYRDSADDNIYVFRNGNGSASNPITNNARVRWDYIMRRLLAGNNPRGVCEIIMYSDTKTDEERTQVRDYLNEKYSIY